MFVGIICFCCAEKQTPIDNFGTETEIQWKSVQELEGLEVHQIIKHKNSLYLTASIPKILLMELSIQKKPEPKEYFTVEYNKNRIM